MAYRIYLCEYSTLCYLYLYGVYGGRVEGSASNVFKANLWAACGCGIVAADDNMEDC